MVKATVMSDATTANPGEHTPKENSVTAGQTDVSFRLWARDDFKVGIWEATPGVRKAIRHNDETCQILGGSVTMPLTLIIRLVMFKAGWMVRSNVISDELWTVIEPVLPIAQSRPGRPWNDHRLTLEGICWRFRTGSPWRDLPAVFGA